MGETIPDLLAIDDKVISVDHRSGLNIREVCSSVGFGLPHHKANGKASHPWQPFLLVLFCAMFEDDWGKGRFRQIEYWGARVRELLEHDPLVHGGLSQTAVGIRPHQADPALLSDFLPELLLQWSPVWSKATGLEHFT